MDKTQAQLKALAELQQTDSRLDKIRQLRGDLPEEVQDLEDELAGLETRIKRLEEENQETQKEISFRKITIQENQDLIKKYEGQLNDVKNNREYEAITKEIELANLDIMTCERKIKQFAELQEERQARIDEVKQAFEERQNDLAEKQKELEQIVQETEKEEKDLLAESDKASKSIEERLLRAYRKIRSSMRNGLAVVTMDRGACGGCFAIIPPQRQYEIRQSRKLIVCENCGRILVDENFFEDQAAQEALAQDVQQGA